MKKALLFLSFIAFTVFNVQAQCTPQPFSGPALSNPDTAVSPAVATQFYSQIIHIRIPADTLVPPATFPIPIDSAGILSVTGLPSSINYLTNGTNDMWPGDTIGCIVLQGLPSQADVGTYDIDVEFIVYAFGMAVTDTLNYDFVVLDSSHVGFADLNVSGFALKQSMPNPATVQAQIDFLVETPQALELEIFNMQGQRVHKQSVDAAKGINSVIINTERFPAGMYVYRINNGTVSDQKRMIVR